MPLVTFRIDYEPQEETEVVCITGSIPALGSWSPRDVQPMTKESMESRWTHTVDVPEGTQFGYRYAVCSFLRAPDPKIVVHQWETNIAPRQIDVKDASYTTGIHTFGLYGGQTRINRGWLVDTREIRLIFEKSAIAQLASFLRCSQCSIRITAMDVSQPLNTIPVLVNNLSSEDFTPRRQAESGEEVDKSSDVITFSTRNLPAGHEVKFTVQLLAKSTHSPAKTDATRLQGESSLVGECRIMSGSLVHSVGVQLRRFFGNDGNPLGHAVPVSYTVIEPLDASEAHSFEVSYATHWKRKRTALNVGHRGMGRSMKDHSLLKDEVEEPITIPENTIFSLKEAAAHGADMVEFDVHVTKDGIPVLFHNFELSLCMTQPGGGNRTEIATFPIKDVTCQQLSAIQKLTSFVLPDGTSTSEFLCENRKAFIEDDALPFSKLQTALETVPMSCGFDIEIKYPMEREKSGMEYKSTPMDMNTSLDVILGVVLKHGGERRIIFSAFSPDVCAMIRMKQSKYPVMLCNFGRTDLYESYTDPRSVTVQRCILTSLSNQILGLVGHGEDYIANPALVGECHKRSLALMCWGERTVDPKIREALLKLGVDGVIHDGMSSFPRRGENKLC